MTTISIRGVLEFPGGCLEELPRLARHDLDVFRPEPQRCSAAIHGGVADSDHEHVLADGIDVLEGDGLQPVDADVDVFGVIASGQLEFLAAGRSAAHENGVEALVQEVFHALDAVVEPDIDADVEDVADLFVQHGRGQAKGRDVVAHQASRHGLCFEYRALVPQRHQVVADRQRSGSRPDQGDFLAVLLLGCDRQAVGDVAAVIGGNAFQATNGHRLLVEPPAPAGRLARAVADAAENAGKHVAFAVDHVGIVEATLGDQANVFGDVGMGRAAPLAVHDLVEIIRIRSICALHRNRPDPVPPAKRRVRARITVLKPPRI